MTRSDTLAGRKTCAVIIGLVAACCMSCSAADVPATQEAIVQRGNGGPEVLQMETVPVLQPGAGQVLIEVHAAAVNPIDWKLRVGYSGPGKPLGTVSPNEPPARIPGFDVAGIVVQVGPGVTSVAPGDRVLSMIGRFDADGLNGTYSQYVIAPADRIVRKPESISFAEAAGLATVGLTAVRTMSPADTQPGDRVFINGIAGGVGSSAAQIAIAAGAVVIGTASARHHEYLDTLGVDQVVDYTKTDFEDVVEPVDVYLETVNRDNAIRGLSIVKPGGMLVSVVGLPDPEACAAANVECVQKGPDSGEISEADYLHRVVALAEEGKFRINIDRAFPLEQAGAAQELNREGHTQGKIVLIVRPEPGE